MPEAVARWWDRPGDLLLRTCEISEIHRDLVTQGEREFGKYAGRLRAQHTFSVFSNLPCQVAASKDGTVHRFRLEGATARTSGFE